MNLFEKAKADYPQNLDLASILPKKIALTCFDLFEKLG